ILGLFFAVAFRLRGTGSIARGLRRLDAGFQRVFEYPKKFDRILEFQGFEAASTVLDIGDADPVRIEILRKALDTHAVYALQAWLPKVETKGLWPKTGAPSKTFEVHQFSPGGLNFPTESFDLVILSRSLQSVHAIANGFVDRGLSECLRVLKPGGLVLVHQNCIGPGFLFPQEVLRALENAGFEEAIVSGHLANFVCSARKERHDSNSTSAFVP